MTDTIERRYAQLIDARDELARTGSVAAQARVDVLEASLAALQGARQRANYGQRRMARIFGR
jgi:hypothetical protein